MWRRLRERWESVAIVWLNACVLFIALNAGVALVQHGAVPDVLRPMRETIALAHPNLDAQSIDALVAESERHLIYEPYTDMTDGPVRGRFVNVDPAGFRYSTDQGPWPPDPRSYNVFVFGGSTTFGYGVGDGDTIASYLQPLVRATDGRPARVYNFGHSGYYSTQERILFTRLLVAGHVPDVAIFVDGLNDSGAVDDVPMTMPRLAAGYRLFENSAFLTALNALPLATTARHVSRLLGIAPPEPAPHSAIETARPDDPAVVRTTVDRYRRSMKAIASVGAANGFRTLFVWQPVPSYRFPPGDAGKWWTGGAIAFARHTYPVVKAMADAGELGRDFRWCADLAADGTEVFYVDRVHYAPVLAERVARCIAPGL